MSSPKTSTRTVFRCSNIFCPGELAATKTCAKCQSVKYCSVECQHQDWKLHKPRCQAIVDCGIQGVARMKSVTKSFYDTYLKHSREIDLLHFNFMLEHRGRYTPVVFISRDLKITALPSPEFAKIVKEPYESKTATMQSGEVVADIVLAMELSDKLRTGHIHSYGVFIMSDHWFVFLKNKFRVKPPASKGKKGKKKSPMCDGIPVCVIAPTFEQEPEWINTPAGRRSLWLMAKKIINIADYINPNNIQVFNPNWKSEMIDLHSFVTAK